MRLLTILILISVSFASCSEITTDDPIDAYEYWVGSKPTDDIEILNGQYWQSGHWTKEYIMYLKIKPTDKWWEEFVKQNQLQITNEDWIRPSDSPDWFQPTTNTESLKQADDFSDSRYFRDRVTGNCFLYEIQL